MINIKIIFNRYARAYREIEACHRDANLFFSNLDLEYAFSYCSGDGVMILNCESGVLGCISEDQLDRLSKSKTRQQALIILREIEFFY